MLIRSCTVAACGGLFRPTITAFIVGHAISTAGKNTLPQTQGLVKVEYLPATTTLLSHLALLVTGRVSCGGETCTYSMQVGTGVTLHKYCISLWLFLSCCFCHVRSNTDIKMAFFSASVSLQRHASIASGCGPVVNVPLGLLGHFPYPRIRADLPLV